MTYAVAVPNTRTRPPSPAVNASAVLVPVRAFIGVGIGAIVRHGASTMVIITAVLLLLPLPEAGIAPALWSPAAPVGPSPSPSRRMNRARDGVPLRPSLRPVLRFSRGPRSVRRLSTRRDPDPDPDRDRCDDPRGRGPDGAAGLPRSRQDERAPCIHAERRCGLRIAHDAPFRWKVSALITALSYHAPPADGGKKDAEGDGPVLGEIKVQAKAGTQTLAYVENDATTGGPAEHADLHKEGAREIALWEDSRRSRRFASITTRSASREHGADYAVWGAAGEPLGTVRLKKASLKECQRTRWTIEQADKPPVVGLKGKIGWW